MTTGWGIGGPAGRPGDQMLQQAVYALNAQRPQEAERIARLIAKADPRNALALHLLGSSLLMQNRAKEAIAPLESAAQVRHDPKIETLLGVALRRSGRSEDALLWLERAAKRRPSHAPAFLEFGCLLAFLKRYDRAIEIFKRGLEVAPMPEFFVQLGHAHLQCRNDVEAKTAFSRAVELSPGYPDAISGLAKTHQGLGDNETAATLYRRCLMIRPNDWDAWTRLGHCLLELGQRDAGYDCFRTAARTDPRRFGSVLASLVKSPHGRFWVRPSAAARFLHGQKS
jgi:tetratricopeptide (TPR) repeat protein